MIDRPKCSTCDHIAQHDHHLTGRGGDGEQLDPSLTVPVCFDCHDLLHDHLRLDQVDRPLANTSVPEVIERRLRRMAIFLSEVAQWQSSLVWVAAVAIKLDAMADQLRRHIAMLDRNFEGWRTVGE